MQRGDPFAGPAVLFRRISTGGRIGNAALHPDAVRQILARRVAMAGLTQEGFERLSAHALRVGFVTEAYAISILRPRCRAVFPGQATTGHPRVFVRLMNAVLPGDTMDIPSDLGAALNECLAADPSVRSDPAFVRLDTLRRRSAT